MSFTDDLEAAYEAKEATLKELEAKLDITTFSDCVYRANEQFEDSKGKRFYTRARFPMSLCPFPQKDPLSRKTGIPRTPVRWPRGLPYSTEQTTWLSSWPEQPDHRELISNFWIEVKALEDAICEKREVTNAALLRYLALRCWDFYALPFRIRGGEAFHISAPLEHWQHDLFARSLDDIITIPSVTLHEAPYAPIINSYAIEDVVESCSLYQHHKLAAKYPRNYSERLSDPITESQKTWAPFAFFLFGLFFFGASHPTTSAPFAEHPFFSVLMPALLAGQLSVVVGEECSKGALLGWTLVCGATLAIMRWLPDSPY